MAWHGVGALMIPSQVLTCSAVQSSSLVRPVCGTSNSLHSSLRPAWTSALLTAWPMGTVPCSAAGAGVASWQGAHSKGRGCTLSGRSTTTTAERWQHAKTLGRYFTALRHVKVPCHIACMQGCQLPVHTLSLLTVREGLLRRLPARAGLLHHLGFWRKLFSCNRTNVKRHVKASIPADTGTLCVPADTPGTTKRYSSSPSSE